MTDLLQGRHSRGGGVLLVILLRQKISEGTAALLYVFLCMVTSAAAQTRIMPLGDSITNGGNGFVSYRYDLWFDLQIAGYAVDFVGARDFLFGGGPDLASYPDYFTTFDRDHEGYWGWRTDEIAAIVTGATTTAQPDVVLIHLGTNDIGQMGAAGVANADTNLRLIIDRIRSVRPNVTILLAQVIPIGPGSGYFPNADQVAPLNTVVATIATEMNTLESPVILVDQNAGFDLATMVQPDGLHPNLAGEAQVADVWFATLEMLLIPGNPPPDVSIASPSDGVAFTAPTGIAISATASDINGFVTQVDFYSGSNLLGTDTSAPYSFDWLDVSVGSYTLTAVATDNDGSTRTSDPVWVRVLPPGNAVAIPIGNPSFENPVIPDGSTMPGPGVIGGWTFTGTANTFVGIFNPPSGSYPSAGGNGAPEGADGVNAAYLYNDGGPAESVAASQELPALLAVDTEYALIVAIGNFLPDQPFGSAYAGYTIELLAGSTVIASDSDSIIPGVGEFRDAIASVSSSGLDPALIGEPLSVRFTISATDARRSTHFDQIRLTSRDLSGPAIPTLSSWSVIVMVLVILVAATIVFGRRERVALSRS